MNDFQIGMALADVVSISLETGRGIRHKSWGKLEFYQARRSTTKEIVFQRIDSVTSDLRRDLKITVAIDEDWYLESLTLHQARVTADRAVQHLEKLRALALKQLEGVLADADA